MTSSNCSKGIFLKVCSWFFMPNINNAKVSYPSSANLLAVSKFGLPSEPPKQITRPLCDFSLGINLKPCILPSST